MPGEGGFDLLDSFKEDRPFEVVFVTAYDQYAIKSIKQGALDYLLKPIDKEEFAATIERITARLSKEAAAKACTGMSPEYLLQKLSVHHNSGFKVITLKDIILLQASNNYTLIRLMSGETITVSRPLKHFETHLDPDWFFRIHKSHIINMNHVVEYVSDDGGYVLMNTGDRIYVSRYKLNTFFEAVSKITKGLKA
jgi:two-component system LytT family response regulator